MKTILATALVLVLAGCATQKPVADEHAARHPASQSSREAHADHMKRMHEMHQKMMTAKTPEERQALMAEHMKAMSMMCEMAVAPSPAK